MADFFFEICVPSVILLLHWGNCKNYSYILNKILVDYARKKITTFVLHRNLDIFFSVRPKKSVENYVTKYYN